MKEQLRKIVREIMREKVISEMNESVINEVDTKKANQIRKAGAGYVGPKFAKKASDEDILLMADLKDEKASLYNRYLKDIMGKISKLQKKYNIKESVNEAKSITLITYGGKKSKYSNSDISRFIGKLDLSSEDLPGFIYKASMGNSNIIGTSAKSYNKKKEAILKLLKKIKSHGGDVIIDVDSKKPSYKQSIKFESVINEGYSTEEKRIVMMAVRKLSKYRNVPIDQSINDLLGAGAELQRDIKKGKIKK